MKGTPDHTQLTVMPSDPEAGKTNCHLIPSYVGLSSATGAMQQQRGVPSLNLASVTAQRGHAGRDPCLLAVQRGSPMPCGVQSGPVGAETSPMRSHSGSMGSGCSPAQPRSAGGAAVPQVMTARPAETGEAAQAGCLPMSARATHRPYTAGCHYPGASSWGGRYVYPLAIGTSRCAHCICCTT